MNEIKRGEIWLINLDPTVGHEIKKTRPALIIQNNIGNKYSTTTIIAPLTSQKTNRVYPYEVLIQNKGLACESKILLNHVRAIDKQRILKKLGFLNEEQMNQVNEAIKISLGLVQIEEL